MSEAHLTESESSASNTGDGSSASNTGNWSSASSIGIHAIARTGACGILTLLEYDDDSNPIQWHAGIVGQDGIESNTWYEAKDGKLCVVADDDDRVSRHYKNMGQEPPEVPTPSIEDAARALLAKIDTSGPEVDALRSALEGGAA